MKDEKTSPKIIIGTKLYREVVNRYNPTEIKELTVSKIGRKYFYVAEISDYNFDLATLQYVNKDYSQSNIQLYKTPEEIEIKNEFNSLVGKLSQYFNNYKHRGNSIEQLRQIAKIIEL